MKTKTPPYGERRRLALDFDLSTQFDNPVWRDFKLIRRTQRITLQQQVQLTAQTQIPRAFAEDQRLMLHKEGGFHHPAT